MCHNIGTESPLQPLSGEQLTLRTANRGDGACLDIAADNFWGRDRNCAFLTLGYIVPLRRVTETFPLASATKKNEQEKKRAYDQRIREVERGFFVSPLVFSTTGEIGPIANVVYKKLASVIAQKHDTTYSKTLHWIRCKLKFSLLRSAIMCLRQHSPSYRLYKYNGPSLPRRSGPSTLNQNFIYLMYSSVNLF